LTFIIDGIRSAAQIVRLQVPKNRSTFSTDDAIYKLLYLAIRNASEKWTMPIRDWGQALNQFAIEFGNERVPFL